MSVVFRFCRLRTNSPAPNNRTRLSATWAATRPFRRNTEPPAPAIDPMVSFSVLHTSGRLARSAGSRPKTMPVRNVTARVNSRMRASGSGWISSGDSFGRHQRQKGARHAGREQHARHAAGERKHQAFDEQLAHQLPPRRADRQAHGDLFLARERAGDEQVGHVAASDQQHQAHHAT